jgi:hypothetical protein
VVIATAAADAMIETTKVPPRACNDTVDRNVMAGPRPPRKR